MKYNSIGEVSFIFVFAFGQLRNSSVMPIYPESNAYSRHHQKPANSNAASNQLAAANTDRHSACVHFVQTKPNSSAQ